MFAVKMFDTFTKFELESLSNLGFPDGQANFLAEEGLPTWCAPNICFGDGSGIITSLPIAEIGGLRWAILGEDRDENPIVVDLRSHTVWVISTHPAIGAPIYMAKDVIELSNALYQFQNCVNIAFESDSEAFTANRIPLDCISTFRVWMSAASPDAIAPGAFWHAVVSWLGRDVEERRVGTLNEMMPHRQ